MSRRSLSRAFTQRRGRAPVFAALGDETRLSLLTKLGDRQPHSISQLTHGSRLTRQAITKHLRVLQRARIVRGSRTGRESRFILDPRPIDDLRHYLDSVSAQWDEALARLKSFVEVEPLRRRECAAADGSQRAKS
jgi:DNA-binding transcriptional ArsR family regulator